MARAPSNPPADPREGFLSRWSRRKAEDGAAAESVAASEPVARDAAVPGPAAAVDPPATPLSAAAPESSGEAPLPPIESLTAESDYKAFLRPGVPAATQRAALRKLWATVPALAPIEIAEAHMGDFNAVPTFPEGLKETLFDAVRGLVERAAQPPSEAQPVVASPPSDPSNDEETPVDSAELPPPSVNSKPG